MNPSDHFELNWQHDRAMELAHLAAMCDDVVKSIQLYRAALEHELQVAEKLMCEFSLEPSRGIIFRSAANLALECGDLEEAERLASLGLGGFPRSDIADELRDVFFDVQFRRHTMAHRDQLNKTKMHVCLIGPTIERDAIDTDLLAHHLDLFYDLIFRTHEKLVGNPFRGAVQRPKDLREQMDIRFKFAGNGAFGFDLEANTLQRTLFGEVEETDLIASTVNVIRQVSTGNRAGLLDICDGDTSYYRYFVNKTNEIIPDGKRLRQVGVGTTAVEERNLSLRPSMREVVRRSLAQPAGDTEHGVPVEVRGYLQAANKQKIQAKKGKTLLKIQPRGIDPSEDMSPVTFEVPGGITGEMLARLWESNVVAQGTLYPGSKFPTLNFIDEDPDLN